jgi:hypothetical protein
VDVLFLLLFLLRNAVLSSGQTMRRHVGVAFAGKTAHQHPEDPNGVSHALGKQAQHDRQQGLAEPWGHHSVCASLRACHGGECPPGPKGVG